MQLQEAIRLLQPHSFSGKERQYWADLGCGSGLFTYALAGLLPTGSSICAIDSDPAVLKSIKPVNEVHIETIQSDFIRGHPGISNLDGIIMANSLHYVQDKQAFIKKISRYMKPAHVFLIVEYDTDRPVSTWVPYPISYPSLKQLFYTAGYSFIGKLHEHPSVYNNGNIYSAEIRK